MLRRRSRILCYHSIGTSPTSVDPGFLRVTPERFEAQLRVLRDTGVEFSTVSEACAAGTPPPRGRLVVTFDDGYADNLHAALPVLQRLGVPATVYVVPGLLGAPSPWLPEADDVRMLEAAEVVELSRAGIEIGAHTMTHPDLTTLADAALVDEVAGSRRALEELIGRPVTSFAYPWFRWTPEVRRAVQDAGFASAVAGPVASSRDDALTLPRAPVSGRHGIGAVLMRLAGVYDPLFESRAGQLARGFSRPARGVVRRMRA